MINYIKKEWYIIILILASLAFGIYVYPQLPDKIPTHWNIHGEVDGWSSKAFGVYFFPLLNLFFYPLMIFLPLIDPRRKNYTYFSKPYKIIRIVLHIFLAAIYIVTLLVALGYPLRVDFIVRFSISLLFIIIGNYMGKFKHNYFVGIKTPWTLANEEVWVKTHRFGAPLWVAVGFLGMVLSFFQQPWASYLTFGGILVIATVPVIYSYLLYRKLNK